MSAATPKKVLILGYGLLGAAFSRLYGTIYDIRGVRRSPFPDAPSPVIRMPIQSEALIPHLEWADIIIFSPATKGGGGRGDLAQYQETYLENMTFLLEKLKRRPLPLYALILISSTGVYPRSPEKTWHEGDVLPVETPRQEILLRTEQAVCASGLPYAILRAGGLHGGTMSMTPARGTTPARGYFHRVMQRGKIYTSEMSENWVSSVHQDDLCGVIHQVIDRGPVNGVYNVVDDTSMKKRELAQWIADKVGLPIESDGPPPPGLERRIATEKLKAELGYRFVYPTAIAFMEAMLEKASSR